MSSLIGLLYTQLVLELRVWELRVADTRFVAARKRRRAQSSPPQNSVRRIRAQFRARLGCRPDERNRSAM